MCEKDGSLVFDQIIFWRWVPSEFRVVAWRILKNVRELPRQLRRQPEGFAWRPKWKGGHTTVVAAR